MKDVEVLLVRYTHMQFSVINVSEYSCSLSLGHQIIKLNEKENQKNKQWTFSGKHEMDLLSRLDKTLRCILKSTIC